MTKFKQSFWVTIGVISLFFFILIILSAVLNLGERLAKVHVYVEYAFYVVSALLFFLLFVRPLFIVLVSPTFSMESLFDEDAYARRNYAMYKKVTKNLLKEDYIPETERSALEKSIDDPNLLKETLSSVFDNTIKKELNKIIVGHAETVFISTAISQNGRLDAVAVLTINLRLIKELVTKCGFRPSYPALGKLSFNVLTSAIVAESLEDMKFSELFPQSSINALAEIPFLKTITGSLAQGSGNALLSLRVGIICRNYLFMNVKGLTKKKVKRLAFAEAVTLFPSVIGESIKKIPKRFKDVFGKIF